MLNAGTTRKGIAAEVFNGSGSTPVALRMRVLISHRMLTTNASTTPIKTVLIWSRTVALVALRLRRQRTTLHTNEPDSASPVANNSSDEPDSASVGLRKA